MYFVSINRQINSIFFTKKCQTVVCFRHVLFLELYLHLKFRKVTGPKEIRKLYIACSDVFASFARQSCKADVSEPLWMWWGGRGEGKAKTTTLSQENIKSLHPLDYHQKQKKLKANNDSKQKKNNKSIIIIIIIIITSLTSVKNISE